MKKFPAWAPAALIEQLARTKSFRDKYPSRDPESIIASTLLKPEFANMSSEAIERLREGIYRTQLDLPGTEGVQILEKLLTDERMRIAWKSLSRRRTSSKGYLQFWSACSGAIIAWRGEQKLTAKQRREFYVQMYDHAAALQSLVQRSREFHLYSINDLISEPSVEWLVDTLDIGVFQDGEQNNGYTRFCLADVVPSIYSIFEDIARRALKYSNEDPLGKR